jgi:hypothetical protein
VRPRVVRITGDRPPWMRYGGRWGDSRASWVPGEMSSPRGPAFHLADFVGGRGQPQGRWSDPDAWADAARPCTRLDCNERGECDERETVVAAVLAALALLGAVIYAARRLRRVPLARAV